jgi:hypothetical protein
MIIFTNHKEVVVKLRDAILYRCWVGIAVFVGYLSSMKADTV